MSETEPIVLPLVRRAGGESNSSEGAYRRGGIAFDRRELTQMTYGVLCFATLLSFVGTVLGGLWADWSWGRFWGWDPKETFAFITWVVFAIYLHARVTYGWKEKRAAIITAFGFAAILFTLYAVNLWIAGLHSYARA